MNIKLFPLTALLLILCNSLYADKAPSKLDSERAIQNEVLVHMNQYRLQHGLAPFKMDERITQEAKKHSQDMANHSMPFGHQQFNRRMQRLHAQIGGSGAGAENVAYNYKNAATVVKNWLLSRGHKHNIDGNYNLTGIGVVRDHQGKLYYTQIFLRTEALNKQASPKPGNSARIFDTRIFVF